MWRDRADCVRRGVAVFGSRLYHWIWPAGGEIRHECHERLEGSGALLHGDAAPLRHCSVGVLNHKTFVVGVWKRSKSQIFRLPENISVGRRGEGGGNAHRGINERLPKHSSVWGGNMGHTPTITA